MTLRITFVTIESMVETDMECDEKIKQGICKADCCGPIPFYKKFLRKNKKRIVILSYEEIPFYDDMIIPVTHDASCIFLTNKYKCNIYNDRPKICKSFADSQYRYLRCPHN